MNFNNVLIVSAHADDETFGMGATISKLKTKGISVHWVVMSMVWEPRWSASQVKQRERDIGKLGDFFDFDSVTRWDYPDNKMETVSKDQYQERMIRLLEEIKPDTVFCPGNSDWNTEHKIAFEVVEMSTKPLYSSYIKNILTYEIPSSTDWSFKSIRNFKRNYYVQINNDDLDLKKKACSLYTTEVENYPHPRSLEGVELLAKTRGMEVGVHYAESFCLVRSIIS
tara:strand:- start:3453 stop:4127 length:675 start_codon:yes stop_codon:yes gene_type:complete